MASPETPWMLPLIVLGGGFVAGAVAARWLRGAGGDAGGDRETALADLEEQSAHCFSQLRDLEEQRVRLDAADYAAQKAEFERRAAELLRARDELLGTKPDRRERSKGGRAAAAAAVAGGSQGAGVAATQPPASSEPAASNASAEISSTMGFLDARPQLRGALWGGLGVGVVAMLMYFVNVDGKPDPNAAPMGMGGGAGGAAPSAGMPASAVGGEGAPLEALDAEGQALMERLQSNPNDIKALLGLSHRFLRGMYTDKAKVLNDRVLAQDPKNAEARVHQAVLMSVGGDQAGALAMLAGLTDEDPSNAEAWFFRGMLGMQTGDQELMQKSLRRYVALAPDGPQKDRVSAMLGGPPADAEGSAATEQQAAEAMGAGDAAAAPSPAAAPAPTPAQPVPATRAN